MKLSYQGIQDTAAFKQAAIKLPAFDWKKMAAKTEESPAWLHFGAGNIFRGFIAVLQQRLLNEHLTDTGIIAAETFDYEIIDKIYDPFDAMSLVVSLKPDGSTEKEVVASIAKGVKTDSADSASWSQLKKYFANPSLQMVSFTITEKGYALTDVKGNLSPLAAQDIENGPEKARHAMAVVAAMLYARYQNGAAPLALVSMDNCSHNGEKLRTSVLTVVKGWVEKGHVPAAFYDYVQDETRIAFPWSMIDKITPRPADVIYEQLTALGIENMQPIVTDKGTYIAPFVNAEVPQYLVVENQFPNGRPPLEKAGVYLTTRDTVNMTERMKVTTCLNPLHTAMSVLGCLLGYTSIAAEMQDEDLVRLVKTIGYKEGLPVVTDPGIISPQAFIDEVVNQRLPNPFIPDTPQRIATDTSQKVGIRFGETIKSYAANDTLNVQDLIAIPLALAGWLRYLLAVDDTGAPMPVSADPQLAPLQSALVHVKFGQPESVKGQLTTLLSNEVIFGVDLSKVGLAVKIEQYLAEMLEGPGAVRNTLKKHLA